MDQKISIPKEEGQEDLHSGNMTGIRSCSRARTDGLSRVQLAIASITYSLICKSIDQPI